MDKSEVGAKLRAVTLAIQSAPERIVAEVRRLEPSVSAEELESFAESYRPPVDDLTCRITEDAESELPTVRQCASGGGRSRDLKEKCRRAFARLVIEDMHRECMEVSFSVC